MKISYYAIFEYEKDGINVTFPDIPNAFTCGFNRKHAKKMAKDVLSLVLHGTNVSNLPDSTDTVFGIASSKKSSEYVKISIRMKTKNRILIGKHIVEFQKGNTNES
jgi:predicted RNase H-like HicB family nuclease